MARKRDERSHSKGSDQKSGCGETGSSNEKSSSSSNSKSSSSGAVAVKSSVNSNPMPVFTSLKQQLATLGLALREIPGDGNCLFGALADQVDGSSDTHFEHRQQIVAYMRQHRLHFEPFVEDDVSFHEHVRRLSALGTFGGNECIVAFARLHNVIVVIHQLNTALWTIKGNEEADGEPPNCEVHISYHNGDHYNSVRRAGDHTCVPANVRLMLTGTSKSQPHPRRPGKPRHDRAQLEIKLMQHSGCEDENVVRSFLEEHEFDYEAALEALINALVNDKVGPMPRLWSEGGTGLRVLGPQAAERVAEEGATGMNSKQRSPTPVEKLQGRLNKEHVSNRQRKEIKKQLKKQKNADRKKQQQDDSDDCENHAAYFETLSI